MTHREAVLARTVGSRAGTAPGSNVLDLLRGNASGPAHNEWQRHHGGNGGFAATLPPEAVDALRSSPYVKFVEPDQPVTIAASRTPNTDAGGGIESGPGAEAMCSDWGADRINQRHLPLDNHSDFSVTGAGANVYVVDTGIRYTHVEFGGRVGYFHDYQGRDGDDCHGDGTHNAGTIARIAPDALLHSVRVLDCSGAGYTSDILDGADEIRARGVPNSIVLMAIGGAANPSLDLMVENLIAANFAVVVAAGSGGYDASNYSPARVLDAITVGATTITDRRASYSNVGDRLDLFAPGTDITSAWHLSDLACVRLSGTSMAAAHAAGVAALNVPNPCDRSSCVEPWLEFNATPDVVQDPGPGSPNLLLYQD